MTSRVEHGGACARLQAGSSESDCAAMDMQWPLALPAEPWCTCACMSTASALALSCCARLTVFGAELSSQQPVRAAGVPAVDGAECAGCDRGGRGPERRPAGWRCAAAAAATGREDGPGAPERDAPVLGAEGGAPSACRVSACLRSTSCLWQLCARLNQAQPAWLTGGDCAGAPQPPGRDAGHEAHGAVF